MLHIITVAHRAQSRNPAEGKIDAQKMFEECLRNTIAEVRPAFVAEEDNEEFLRDKGQVSISLEVANELKIDHRFCEPNTAERAAIGSRNFIEISLELWTNERLSNQELEIKARAIEIARYFPIRERFWLNRLHGCREQDAIFSCGDIHIEGFQERLAENGIAYRIVQRAIGRNAEDDPYYEALEYLRKHPGLKNPS